MTPPPIPPGSALPNDPLAEFGEFALEAYLDGAMSPVQRSAFEARLAADPVLRREAALAGTMDAELKQSLRYTPPSAARLDAALRPAPDLIQPKPTLKLSGRPSGGERAEPPRLRRTLSQGPGRWLAVAASLAMLSYAGWTIYRTYAPQTQVATVPVGWVHERLVKAGYTPEFVCTTDEEFRRTVSQQFGQELSFPPTEGVELVGWAYGDNYMNRIMGPKTLVLMTRVHGEPVTVMIDDKQYRSCLTGDHPPGLLVEQRVIGDLVAVEVTPRKQAAIVPRLLEPK